MRAGPAARTLTPNPEATNGASCATWRGAWVIGFDCGAGVVCLRRYPADSVDASQCDRPVLGFLAHIGAGESAVPTKESKMSIVESTAYAAPGEPGSLVALRERYENFIGGEWIAPITGEYRENLTPSTGEPFCEVAHSGAQDIELALDAAHAAKAEWGQRSPAERAAVLNDIADATDENAEMLAVAES